MSLIWMVLSQVRVFYTAPTLLRSLMQAGDEWVTKHDRSSLRVLGTVGEPIGQNAWNWFGAFAPESSIICILWVGAPVLSDYLCYCYILYHGTAS